MNADFEQQHQRLKRLTEGENVIPYIQSLADRELPGLKWSVYGIVDTNELVLKAVAGSFCVYVAAPSRVLYPAVSSVWMSKAAIQRHCCRRSCGKA